MTSSLTYSSNQCLLVLLIKRRAPTSKPWWYHDLWEICKPLVFSSLGLYRCRQQLSARTSSRASHSSFSKEPWMGYLHSCRMERAAWHQQTKTMRTLEASAQPTWHRNWLLTSKLACPASRLHFPLFWKVGLSSDLWMNLYNQRSGCSNLRRFGSSSGPFVRRLCRAFRIVWELRRPI